MTIAELKALLLKDDVAFWQGLATATASATAFDELFMLASLRKKALARKLDRPGVPPAPTRLALLGACSLYPFRELLEHLCDIQGTPCEIWSGDFDNYISEITDDSSALYHFAPQLVFLIPSAHRCRYSGNLTDPRDVQQAVAQRTVDDLLSLLRTLHDRTRAEILLANFMPPAGHDLGAFRSRTLGSDWSFRKFVNLELGLQAPPFVHICDMEFLATRFGTLAAHDARAWFESKQPCSANLLPALARETAHLIASLRRAPRKVLVLDLDNTIWGGVIADDGLEGIELGDTSPRGEAFKAFQRAILALKARGILLAVCSKNDHARAAEPFEKHPEMVLRMDDFVAFKANWEPKSDNIRQMAADLNLGLDSFAFVDDNPAEIEIVRQFAPEVATILLGPDPSEYVAQLQDSRLFEPRSITAEDAARTRQYQAESQRKSLQSAVTDMASYLESLEMEATICEFRPVDAPRLSQLINKSNQFNLTTRRRTEADVLALIQDPAHVCFSIRLKDRFGDHGLISILIGKQVGDTLEIDTWLMSCRVLKRQVEEAALNELARLALARGCTRLLGIYIPTPKNEMVRDFYPRMGFTLSTQHQDSAEYERSLAAFQAIPNKIQITQHAYASA